MEVELEPVGKPTELPPTVHESPLPPHSSVDLQVTDDVAVTTVQPRELSGSVVKRNGSLLREVHRKGSLRRDQRTGEKRRSRTGSLLGYEAKYPVSQ